MGQLNWPPDVFWSATPRDLCAAYRGRLRTSSGLDDDDRQELYNNLIAAREGGA